MKWVETPPTKPGFYWTKTVPDATPMVVEVYKDRLGDLYFLFPGLRHDFQVGVNMWWSSEPVPAPEGKTDDTVDPEPGWGWMFPDADTADGPFDSREACIADARAYIETNGTLTGRVHVVIGRCVYPSPEDYVPVDLDETMERMSEAATDDGFYADDQLFDDDETAGSGLKAALAAWAKAHVTSSTWTLEDIEDVMIDCDAATNEG